MSFLLFFVASNPILAAILLSVCYNIISTFVDRKLVNHTKTKTILEYIKNNPRDKNILDKYKELMLLQFKPMLLKMPLVWGTIKGLKFIGNPQAFIIYMIVGFVFQILKNKLVFN